MKKFKGDDWTELSERWGCDYEDDEVTLCATRRYMSSCFGEPNNMAAAAKDIREYLAALIRTKKDHYEIPIWKGFLKIKKSKSDADNQYADEVLIKYTSELLGYMWN